ncbi:MAG: hypothetical protein JO122_13300 [Acetobacteraceae bacterium]|nr:hypothetical protein [Acetobacteraceae bacterium]
MGARWRRLRTDLALARKISRGELRAHLAAVAEMFDNGGLLKTAEADGAGGPLAVRLLVQPDADVIVKISTAQIANDNLPAQLQQTIAAMVTGLSSAQRRIDAVRRVIHSAVAALLGVCGIGGAWTASDVIHGVLFLGAFLALGAVMRMLRGPVLRFVLRRALR